MNDARLIERLAKTDPVATAIPLPDGWSADAHLRELEQRMRMQPEATTRPTGSARSSRRLLPVAPPPSGRGRFGLAAAAIAVAIGVVAAAAFVGRTSVLSPAAPATIDGETALATADRIFAAHNAGDPDAAIAEFLPDATIEFHDKFYGSGPVESADWYLDLVWSTASGTTWADPVCVVTDDGDGTAVTVACQYGLHTAPLKAVGAPAEPFEATIVLRPGGVSHWDVEFDASTSQHLEVGFGNWMIFNHPDAFDEPEGRWTVEEVREDGARYARYADEWAEFLEARDCGYPTECFFETPATGGE